MIKNRIYKVGNLCRLLVRFVYNVDAYVLGPLPRQVDFQFHKMLHAA